MLRYLACSNIITFKKNYNRYPTLRHKCVVDLFLTMQVLFFSS